MSSRSLGKGYACLSLTLVSSNTPHCECWEVTDSKPKPESSRGSESSQGMSTAPSNVPGTQQAFTRTILDALTQTTVCNMEC